MAKSPIIALAMLLAAPALAASTPKPPAEHRLTATDQEMQALAVAIRDIGKLCQISDDDCVAQIQLRKLAVKWNAQLAAEKKPDARTP